MFQQQCMGNVRESERNTLDVFEMKCPRSMVGVTRMGRVRNEEARRRVEIVRKTSERVDQMVLSWYGEELWTKRVWKAEVSGPNLRGRPRRG